jgi:hypothetical protein
VLSMPTRALKSAFLLASLLVLPTVAETATVGNALCPGEEVSFNPGNGDHIVVPDGFKVSVFASGLNFPTGIAFRGNSQRFEVWGGVAKRKSAAAGESLYPRHPRLQSECQAAAHAGQTGRCGAGADPGYRRDLEDLSEIRQRSSRSTRPCFGEGRALTAVQSLLT